VTDLPRGSLSKRERLAYINAVKCLQSKPSKYPSGEAPGAKSRYDDFVVVHIKQTLEIHYTANFLSWHRWFTWAYETALREECGYTGAQPYWNWGFTAITGLKNSPIFDGSATSMSGDGAPLPGKADQIMLGASQGLDPIYLPVGSGGGCVTSGPFSNMTVNLGPAALDLPGGLVDSNPAGPLAYNPRCLKRDLTDAVNQEYSNTLEILLNIVQPTNVMDFQMQMQGVPGSGRIGIHGGGHYSLGGDPGRDVFVSPGDPVFYLHHSMIDRVWWMWQMIKPSERAASDKAIDGTRTFLNQPPSANGTLDDLIDLEYAFGPATPIRDLLSSVNGPLCYAYL
jgi:tyrosinase